MKLQSPRGYAIHAAFVLLVSVPLHAISQNIHPGHLFNAGINMGFLNQHHKNGSARDQYGIWASNTAEEWLASWTPGTARVITPSIENPSGSIDEYNSAMSNMPLCQDPYFLGRHSIFRAGLYLGQALVETGSSCGECLRQEMQKAAIELRTLSTISGKSLFVELSNTLNSHAGNLNTSLRDELASQQNQAQFAVINSTLKTVQSELPNTIIYCQKKKEKKRIFILKAGGNNAILKGDQGTKTAAKTGFLVGFDMYRGDPVFFDLGLKFFRNSTGEELMIPLPGQVVDTDNYYIQGFIFSAGVGGYLYRKDDFVLSAALKLNYLFSHAINGKFTSVGLTKVSDNAFHLEVGAGVAYKILFVEITYEPGLTDAITSDGEEFKYQMINFSIGLRLK